MATIEGRAESGAGRRSKESNQIFSTSLDALREDGLLTASEVAALLKCSVRNVYALLRRNELPRPLKIGALSRWRLSALRHWMAHGCRVG